MHNVGKSKHTSEAEGPRERSVYFKDTGMRYPKAPAPGRGHFGSWPRKNT